MKYLGWCIGLVCLLLVVGYPIWRAVSPPAAVHSVPSPSPESTVVSQRYWYCWDVGALRPHHVGHRQPDDHLCTDGELRRAGITP